MKRTTCLISFAVCLLLSVSCTTTDPFVAADSMSQRGDYEAALQQYQSILNSGNLTPEQRVSGKEKMDSTLRILVAELIEESTAEVTDDSTMQELETAVANLEALSYDDPENSVRKAMHQLEDRLESLRDEYDTLLSRARVLEASLDWEQAHGKLEEALVYTSNELEVKRLQRELMERRNEHLQEQFASLLASKDMQKVKAGYERMLGLQPAIPGRMARELYEEMDTLREDLIPGKLLNLIGQKRYYEAYLLLGESNRASTQERFSFLAREGAEYYTEIAQSAMQDMPQRWGPAYFAASAALEMVPDNTRYFETMRRARDKIEEYVRISVGIAEFNSPHNEPDAGPGFSASLTSRLKESIPYGIKIIDPAVIERERSRKSSSWDFFVKKRDLRMVIAGTVARLTVESNVTQFEEIRSYQRTVRQNNPDYSKQVSALQGLYGRDPSTWPEEPKIFLETEEEVRYPVTVHFETLDGAMRVNVHLTKAIDDAIEEAREFTESVHMDDKYHGGYPDKGIEANLRDLPSKHEIVLQMRSKLVEQVSEMIRERYSDRAGEFYADYRQARQRRVFHEAFQSLAGAHLYLIREHEIQGTAAMEAQAEAYYREGLIDLYAELNQFHRASAPALEENPDAVAPAEQLKQAGGRHYALIIGISDYQDDNIPDLQYADTDAVNLYNWMVDESMGGYDPETIKILRNQEATTRNIRKTVNDWLAQTVEEDFVTIFFAGHGSPASPERPDDLYLLTYDTEFSHIESTAYPMEELGESIGKYIGANRLMVVADACHSGGIGANFALARRSMGERALRPVQITAADMQATVEQSDEENRNRSLCFISASSPDQTSIEGPKWGGGQGVFTHTMLRGLRGEADYNADRQVTLGELTNFLSTVVARETNKAQTPNVSGTFDPSMVVSTY